MFIDTKNIYEANSKQKEYDIIVFYMNQMLTMIVSGEWYWTGWKMSLSVSYIAIVQVSLFNNDSYFNFLKTLFLFSITSSFSCEKLNWLHTHARNKYDSRCIGVS